MTEHTPILVKPNGEIVKTFAVPVWKLGHKMNFEIAMPEYYDGTERRHFENPWLKWPTILSGVIMLLVGFDIWTNKGDAGRGVSWMVMGFGMAVYGITVVFLRNSPFKWLALLLALIAWFGGLFGAWHFTQ